MDQAEIVIVGRVIERLLIVVLGGVSLAMGWHLYLKGVDKKQSAELQHDKTIIRFRDVGPGAFFSIVGALVLVASVANVAFLRWEEQGRPPGSNQPSSRATEIRLGTSLSQRSLMSGEMVAAITTLERDIKPGERWYELEWKRVEVMMAVGVLSKSKNEALSKEFEDYELYLTARDAVKTGRSPASVGMAEERYKEIDVVVSKTMGDQ